MPKMMAQRTEDRKMKRRKTKLLQLCQSPRSNKKQRKKILERFVSFVMLMECSCSEQAVTLIGKICVTSFEEVMSQYFKSFALK